MELRVHGAHRTSVEGAPSMDWTGEWVVFMASLRGVDNRKIPLLARN
jgi:hypothetical protein